MPSSWTALKQYEAGRPLAETAARQLTGNIHLSQIPS